MHLEYFAQRGTEYAVCLLLVVHGDHLLQSLSEALGEVRPALCIELQAQLADLVTQPNYLLGTGLHHSSILLEITLIIVKSTTCIPKKLKL